MSHRPSESEKTAETMTKSSRQGDDGLGCTAWDDVRQVTGDCEDRSFTPTAEPLATPCTFD